MKKGFTLIELFIAIMVVTLILFGFLYFLKAKRETAAVKSNTTGTIESTYVI